MTKHLKPECYSATLNKDTVLQEEDDENIYAAALALSKANVGLVPLTLLAPVQRRVVSLLQMLHRNWNAADIQELVRVFKTIRQPIRPLCFRPALSSALSAHPDARPRRDMRQRSATTCSWSASSATWNRFRTHLRSHTGTQWLAT